MKTSLVDSVVSVNIFDHKLTSTGKSVDLEKISQFINHTNPHPQFNLDSRDMESQGTGHDLETPARKPLQSLIGISISKLTENSCENLNVSSELSISKDPKKSRQSQKNKVLRKTLKRGIEGEVGKESQWPNGKNVGTILSPVNKIPENTDHLLSFRSDPDGSTHFTKEDIWKFESRKVFTPHNNQSLMKRETTDQPRRARGDKGLMIPDESEYSLECEICMEELDTTSIILKCMHLFCDKCYKSYAEERINFDTILGIKCPKEGCNEVLSDKHLCMILEEHGWLKYQRLKKVALLNQKKNLRWCPDPNCGKYTLGKKGTEKVTCECGKDICFKCGNEQHSGKTCEAVLDVAFHKYVQHNNIHKCPYCRARIEKFDGCNHITCPICAYEFCWLCGKHYTPTHYSIANPEACSKLPRGKEEYAKKTFRTYLKKVFEGILMLCFLPVMLLILAINMPTWHYEKYLEKKQSVANRNQSEGDDDCFFRTFLLFLGLLFFPVSLIYLVIYRAFRFLNQIITWLRNRNQKNDDQSREVTVVTKNTHHTHQTHQNTVEI